jgi:peptide/nickel transport system substrate-binding protein
MKNRFLVFMAILIIGTLILSGCAQSSPSPAASAKSPQVSSAAPTTSAAPSQAAAQPKRGGTMKVIVRSPSSIIGTPSEGPGGAPHRLVEVAYDFLVRYDQNYNFSPRLADSWTIAPDGKSITFNLHKGIKFTDGTPFNAAAVKANLEVYAPNGVRTPSLKQIASYDLVDEYTIRLNLSKFDSTLMIDLGDGPGFMCSPAALAKSTTPENMTKDHLIGTGPFMFSSFEKNQNIKYVKNPNYWQAGKPYLDAFEFYMVTDPVTSMMSFKKGEGQVIFGITATEAKDLKAAGFNIVPTDIKPIAVLLPDGLNKDSPWANKNAREALEYAIDKTALAKSVGDVYYDPVTQFAVKNTSFYTSEAVTRNYDPKKAKDLLAAGGLPNGFKTKIYASTTWDKDVLVAIQTYLKEVGIDAELDLADAARMTDMQTNGWKNGIYIPTLPIIPNIRSLSFRLAGSSFVSMYHGSDWQAKVDATVAQADAQKQLAQFKDLIKQMNDEASCISLWTKPDISALDKSVQGLKWTEGGHPRFYEPQDAWINK